jgi:hypothetical protein
MSKEYAIWGKCEKSGHEETLLASQIKTLAGAQRGEKLLQEKYGCYDTRIQTLDFSSDLAETWRDAAKS